jgi:hypothetical protein
MKEQLANKIIELMLKHGAELNEILMSIKESSNDEEFDFYRKSIGKVMGYMLLDVMNPIFKEYPSLKPGDLK